jgi:hypothetical protein
MRSRPRLRRPRQWSTYSGPPKGGFDCTSQSLLNSWHNQAKVLGLSEERQVSMLITQGLQSRELAASACGMKMAKLGSTRDVAPRWGPGINNWDMGFFSQETLMAQQKYSPYKSPRLRE